MLSEAVEGGGARIKVCVCQIQLEKSLPLCSHVNLHHSEFICHLNTFYTLVLKLLWVVGDLQVKLLARAPCKVSTSSTQASGTLL